MALCKVQVMDVRIDVRNESPVVILRDAKKRDMYLPIWVGEAEAASIQMAIERKQFPRPLTHDLIANLLDVVGVRPVLLRIDRIVEQTYFAEMVIEKDDSRVDIDCRPSDGIALALRKNIPIYVEEQLLYEIKFSEDEEPMAYGEFEGDAPDGETFKKFLEAIEPKDFLCAPPGDDAARED